VSSVSSDWETHKHTQESYLLFLIWHVPGLTDRLLQCCQIEISIGFLTVRLWPCTFCSLYLWALYNHCSVVCHHLEHWKFAPLCPLHGMILTCQIEAIFILSKVLYIVCVLNVEYTIIYNIKLPTNAIFGSQNLCDLKGPTALASEIFYTLCNHTDSGFQKLDL